jgi:hypothetical protein
MVIDRSGHPDWAKLIANAMGATVTTRRDSSRYVDATVSSARTGVRLPSRSTRSCPQAAAISIPRLFRIATSTPLARTARANTAIPMRSCRREVTRATGMQRNQIDERLAPSCELGELRRLIAAVV